MLIWHLLSVDSYTLHCTIVIFGLAIYIALKYYLYKESIVGRLPGPRASSWILGSLVDFYSSPGEDSASVAWCKTYGRVTRFKGFLGQDRIQICDPTAVAHLFNSGPYNYEKETITKPRYEIMFGAGLLSANGAMHHRLRRIMLPAFGTSQIAQIAPVFEKCANDIKERWIAQIKASPNHSCELPMAMDSSFGLLNAIGEAAFGYDFDVFNKGGSTPLFQALAYLDSLSNNRSYGQILLECFTDNFPAWMMHLIMLLPIKNGRGLRYHLDVLSNTARDLFQQGLEDAKLGSASRKDLLSVLVRANLASDAKFQLEAEQVQNQLLTFVIAGWGTVLSVLSNFMFQLSQDQAVQSRLREEMQSLGDHPTLDQLQHAPYLDAVLKEAIRVVGVTPLERIATRDDLIPLSKPIQLTDGSWTSVLPVKKGQSLSIAIQAMNFDCDRFGPDAAAFRPERWLGGEEGENLRSFTGFGPNTWNGLTNFGGGTRACIGNKFALAELRIFTHTFLTHFRFEQGSNPWSPRACLL